VLPWGDTRWRARVKQWKYLWNPIKTNSGVWLYARQELGRGRSVELAYAYSPAQYIRQLTDRAPFTPADDPLVWEDFRYTRNGQFIVTAQGTLATAQGFEVLGRNGGSVPVGADGRVDVTAVGVFALPVPDGDPVFRLEEAVDLPRRLMGQPGAAGIGPQIAQRFGAQVGARRDQGL